MTSNRRGQAQSALHAVEGRHQAIHKIEEQMIELAQLFQDMEAAVVQQEPAVEIIDQKAEDTQMNISKGNEQLDQAVVKARSARRKKWICLGIASKSNLCSQPNTFSALLPIILISTSPHRPDHCGHHRLGAQIRRPRLLNAKDMELTAFSSNCPHHRCCYRYRGCRHQQQFKERHLINFPSNYGHAPAFLDLYP